MMEKTLVLQLQVTPNWADRISEVARLTQIVDCYCTKEDAQWRIDEDASHSDWINVEVSVLDPRKTWGQLREEFAKDDQLFTSLSTRWIVVGQGSQGWSNYKTFAHYDPRVKLDTRRG